MKKDNMQEDNKKIKKKLLIFSVIFLCVLMLPIVCLYAKDIINQKQVMEQREAAEYKGKLKRISLDYDQLDIKVLVEGNTVKEVLNELGIEVEEDDFITPAKDSKIYQNSLITIRKKTPFEVIVDGDGRRFRSFSKDVKEALSEVNIEYDNDDIIEPGLSENLTKNLEIKITRIETEEFVESERIEFETIEKEDPDLDWGKVEIKEDGEYGEKKVTYKVVYEDGEVASKETIKEEIVKEPKNKIVSKGTKMKLGKASKGDASWYAYTGKMACASLEHPKGTWLKVTNLENGKSVKVIVNDSGPYVPGRIIDLDKEAFKKIGSLSQGVIRVKVEKIK